MSATDHGLDPSLPGLRPFSEIPRAPLVRVLRNILGNGGGRIDMLSGLRAQYEQQGPVVSQLGGPLRFVNLFGPDANRTVLLDRERIFSARRPWMQIMGRIFPNGLLLWDGDEHRHQRKIMREAFKRPILREYASQMNPRIEAGIAEWGRDGSRLLAFDAFKKLTLDMAAAIFVGVDLGDDGARRMNRAFEDMVAASMSRVRLPLPGLEFNRGLTGRRYLLETFGGMLATKRASAGPDIFSRLCHAENEEGERLTDEQVLDHIIFLMMAAHDTTTSTLTSLAYELARHPEWQERVRAESRAFGKDHPSFAELDQLEALTWAMRETLRRYPPLPVIPRITTADFEWEGYRIPARSMVVVSPIHSHYMEEWWTDPQRFDPERFSPQRAEHERHTHLWIPFGGGVHMCLGFRFAETQIRTIMHQLVLRYRWSVPRSYQMPVQQAPISKPRDGLPLTLERLSD